MLDLQEKQEIVFIGRRAQSELTGSLRRPGTDDRSREGLTEDDALRILRSDSGAVLGKGKSGRRIARLISR
jgi:hypothetical protein